MIPFWGIFWIAIRRVMCIKPSVIDGLNCNMLLRTLGLLLYFPNKQSAGLFLVRVQFVLENTRAFRRARRVYVCTRVETARTQRKRNDRHRARRVYTERVCQPRAVDDDKRNE